MQTVIQVIAAGTGSLREKIMTDSQLGRFNLIPSEHQRPGVHMAGQKSIAKPRTARLIWNGMEAAEH
jgi:hypothetical protein